MFEQVFKNIDDVLWKEAGCTTELDYTEQTARPPATISATS
jgi:type I restriction enzyme M protein